MSIRFFTAILVCMFLMASCRKEQLPAPVQNRDLVELKFNLGTPAVQQQAPQTYSVSAADENAIHQIILLAFKVSGGVETLDYYKEGMQIYAGSAMNEKSFYTSLLKSEDTYRFVVLVNGGEQISNIVETLVPGSQKDLVMEQLIYAVSGKWNSTSSADFSPLPMWGESPEIEGIHAQTVLPQIRLLRSLVRVDVKLDADALSNFTIESVHIYGANDQVRMAPLSINYNDLTNQVNDTSIPAGTAASLDFVYNGFGSVSILEREIYLPEADAGTTRIVIGGFFDTDIQPTYYEAVLGTSLLRNNRYTIKITKVNASGDLLPEDALSIHIPGKAAPDKNLFGIAGIKDAGILMSSVSVAPDE